MPVENGGREEFEVGIGGGGMEDRLELANAFPPLLFEALPRKFATLFRFFGLCEFVGRKSSSSERLSSPKSSSSDVEVVCGSNEIMGGERMNGFASSGSGAEIEDSVYEVEAVVGNMEVELEVDGKEVGRSSSEWELL